MTIGQFEKAKPLYNQIETYKKLITELKESVVFNGISPIITHGFLKKDFIESSNVWIEKLEAEIKRLEKEIERI